MTYHAMISGLILPEQFVNFSQYQSRHLCYTLIMWFPRELEARDSFSSQPLEKYMEEHYTMKKQRFHSQHPISVTLIW